MFGLTLTHAVDYLASQGEGWGQAALALCAFVEYIFPPFPGDVLAVAGALLARLSGWNVWLVVISLTSGNLAGAAVAYWVGARGLSRERLLKTRRGAARKEGIDRVIAGYRKYGAVFLVANRFMPGIRAFFFVAAGTAGIRLWLVLLYAGISALAWNGLLVFVGYLMGDNFEMVEKLFSQYFLAAWGLVVASCVAAAIWFVRAR